MTLSSGIAHLVVQMLTLAHQDGSFPAVEQVDFDASEDGGVIVYVHFADDETNGGLPITGSSDLGEVSRDEVEMSLIAASLLYKALSINKATENAEGRK